MRFYQLLLLCFDLLAEFVEEILISALGKKMHTTL